jgi:hypothetical protein
VPQARHEQRQFLQMAVQVRWHGCVEHEAFKELEQENTRLKKMYAEEKLEAEIISEALEKEW